MLELFHYDFFQNALLSTLFIGISCGLVGTYIVARRMVFISGGITHASFGGLGLSFYLGLPPMLGATCFALLSALGIQCLGARRKISEDSLIGIFWSAGMAIGILFIYLTPGYAPDLMSYLFGNILTVTPAQLILSAVLCGLILLFFALFSRPLFYIAFDREYSQTHHVRGGTLDTAATVIIALCIVLCLKLAGIILIISYLTIPQTIDNDVWGTDSSIGFDSAVEVATEAIDRLHSTASSHKRVMVIEVMGHKAGWIALYAGMAGGGDVILIPEIPYNIHNVGELILNRLKQGKPYSIVVVAEGIPTDGRKRAGEYIAQEIEYETGIETRETVLGYIQRGGSPTPFDRNLATRMGGHAADLIASGQFGRMVTLLGSEISSIPLAEVAGKLKMVTEDNDLVMQGRQMGVCFG